MVLAPEPVFAAVEAAAPVRPLYLLGPGGRRFDQAMARELAGGEGFSLLCGRYEGVDERVAEHLVDGELCIGDYVLAGGEAAAIVVVEAVARLVPGVMGNLASSEEESFTDGLLEVPAVHQAGRVPGVGSPRGPAVGPPRARGPVAKGGCAGPHVGAPARLGGGARRALP